MALLDEVFDTQARQEREVSVGGRPYLLRVLPYRMEGAQMQGAVVTLIDVGALKQAQAQVRELDRRNQAVLSGLSDSILCWDAQNEAVLFHWVDVGTPNQRYVQVARKKKPKASAPLAKAGAA